MVNVEDYRSDVNKNKQPLAESSWSGEEVMLERICNGALLVSYVPADPELTDCWVGRSAVLEEPRTN